MDRRTQHFRDSYKSPGQEFDVYRQEYRLNHATNCLEEDGLVDISAEVNSFRDLALDKQVERFMPVIPDFTQSAEVDGYRDMLDEAMAFRQKMDAYKSQFKMSDDTSDDEVLAEVGKRADALAESLKKYTTQKEVKEDAEVQKDVSSQVSEAV